MPCLVTLKPDPATTNEEIVDILNVSFPSPPVPHRSIVLKSLKSIPTQSSSNASLKPSISSIDGFLILKAVINDAISEFEYLLVVISISTLLA